MELDYQDEFIQIRNRNFIGRGDLVQVMRDYVSKGQGDKPLVLAGTAGEGKSSLMANFAKIAVSEFYGKFDHNSLFLGFSDRVFGCDHLFFGAVSE